MAAIFDWIIPTISPVRAIRIKKMRMNAYLAMGNPYPTRKQLGAGAH